MFHKEWQVCLTYLTQRWLWFLGLVVASFVGGGYSAALTGDGSRNPFQASFILFPLAMPIMLGGAFLVSVVKWQFANPHARLIPGYVGPHLLVLGTILAVMLVINPLLLTLALGVPAWGPLAFTVLVGGGYVWAVGANRGGLMIPVLALFFFSMTDAGKNFWFLEQEPYLVRHGLLAILGAALVGGWLWRLAHLNEEMADYQIQPMAGWNRPSRLESTEARKFVGRMASRRGIHSWLGDRWHDQLPRQAVSAAQKQALLCFGFDRLPKEVFGVTIAVFMVALTVVLNQIIGWNDDSARSSTFAMSLVITLGIPPAIVVFHFKGRQGRMAQELLFPLTRMEYLDGLLWALARELVTNWLVLLLTLGGLVASECVAAPDASFQTVVAFALFSAALQVPSFGIALRLARFRSGILFGLSAYGVVIAQIGLLSLWWNSPPFLRLLIVGFLIVLGIVLIRRSRQKWLDTELG